jgi:hypothetical protein
LVQHKTGNGQRLGTFVIEKRINVGNKLADPGVQLQPLTQAGHKAASDALPVTGLARVAQAERANPQVRSTRYCVGCFEWVFLPGRLYRMSVVLLHPGNVEIKRLCLLSQAVIFDSISFICSMNPPHWLL